MRSASIDRGPLFTDVAPAPVLATLMQYVDNDGLQTMAGDCELTAGLRIVPGFNAFNLALTELDHAEHKFLTALREKDTDPSNVHAFDNARLREAYDQHVAKTHCIPPAVKSRMANTASALLKVPAAGFTYLAVTQPDVGTGFAAGVNWFNACASHLLAIVYRRQAARQRDLDMATAVSNELDRLGTAVTTANGHVSTTLEKLRAMNQDERPVELSGGVIAPELPRANSSTPSSSSSSSSVVIHIDDEDPELNPQS